MEKEITYTVVPTQTHLYMVVPSDTGTAVGLYPTYEMAQAVADVLANEARRILGNVA